MVRRGRQELGALPYHGYRLVSVKRHLAHVLLYSPSASDTQRTPKSRRPSLPLTPAYHGGESALPVRLPRSSRSLRPCYDDDPLSASPIMLPTASLPLSSSHNGFRTAPSHKRLDRAGSSSGSVAFAAMRQRDTSKRSRLLKWSNSTLKRSQGGSGILHTLLSSTGACAAAPGAVAAHTNEPGHAD